MCQKNQSCISIDENLPVDAAELLHLAGYDATTVIEEYLGGEKDVRIAAVCQGCMSGCDQREFTDNAGSV
jgi:hypothetical protein